jgi:hypothetical protein
VKLRFEINDSRQLKLAGDPNLQKMAFPILPEDGVQSTGFSRKGLDYRALPAKAGTLSAV